MPRTSGFTQRWKGATVADAPYFKVPGGAGVLVAPADLGTLAGFGAVQALSTTSTSNVVNGPGGFTTINASSALSIFQLSAPAVGVEKVLSLTVSSGVFVKAAAGAAFDGSTNTVIKSTQSGQLTLVGLSSLAYRIGSFWPGSTQGGAPSGGLTLSTTT